MTQKHASNQSASLEVLNIGDGETPVYLTEKMTKKTLSQTMSELNRDYLNGNDTERELARRALLRLGFLTN